MLGEFEHTMDAKGRVFVPAKLRDELGGEFYITVSMDRCLCVYSAESWQSMSGKCAEMPYVKQRKMRPIFALAAKCETDSQGRVLLPLNLREYAGLTREVAIVGCNNHAEIWDLRRWKEVNAVEMSPDNIAAVMEELNF